MQRCHERGKKRFKELDKECFHGREEIFDIRELQDALVGDLCKGGGGSRRTTSCGRRTRTYDKDELEVVYKGPFDCIAILFVFFFGSSPLNECLADERVDRRCGGRSYMRCFGRERARPEYDAA